jgi:hypothetical protein
LAGTPIALGGSVGRATSLSNLTGFSVFDQAYGMINTPQSPVPTVGSYGQVMFFRLGSGARLAIAMAPSLVSLEGELITTQVSWDFSAQQLVPYAPAYASTTLTGASWASTSGGQITYTGLSNNLTSELSAGSVVDISGVVSTGGTGLGYNGTFVVVSVTSSTLVVTFLAASSPGTYSSGGTIAGGGGALACKIIRVKTTNCMTVNPPDVNGNVSWNRNGACAVIVI